jgi:hypothetical protein
VDRGEIVNQYYLRSSMGHCIAKHHGNPVDTRPVVFDMMWSLLNNISHKVSLLLIYIGPLLRRNLTLTLRFGKWG